ncbi:hypothetical protein LZ012_07660 [Dechloromonas sp. XY25]|uniref:Uncharacterized protein n=1 Tax=Dechloromonas hankyongensis TaxID=2908002 RepID=A0ABS9K135_9RHOO|nr:hypothetical protein [Dechloromonas hankyongensis]MCG2576868.1 hypothetical protein [Dechloromonas hankyongensis]
MRAQFRQERLVGGIVAGKTPYQKSSQAIFLGTKPCFSVYSLHRGLWLHQPEKIPADVLGKEILPELVTIHQACANYLSDKAIKLISHLLEGRPWQTLPI